MENKDDKINEEQRNLLAEQYKQQQMQDEQYEEYQEEYENEGDILEENLERAELFALKERLGEPKPFKLSITISGEEVESLTFDQDIVTIGRDIKCDVVINNLGASRIHAQIDRFGRFYLLKDANSKTGTFVRGNKIEEYVLNSGDDFFMAKHSIYFERLETSSWHSQEKKKGVIDPYAIRNMARTMAVDFRNLAKKQEIAPAYLQEVGTRRRIPISTNTTFFGKSEFCQVAVGGFMIGDKHAVLSHEKEGFLLYHLGMVRPPKVNKKSIEQTRLQNGDVIEIGDLKAIFSTTH